MASSPSDCAKVKPGPAEKQRSARCARIPTSTQNRFHHPGVVFVNAVQRNPVQKKPNIFMIAMLRLVQLWDRFRLLRLARRHSGLKIDPRASSNLACAKFDLAPGAELVIGPGVVTERIRHGVRFEVGSGSSVVVEDGVWLRSDIAPVFLRASEGARIKIGSNSELSACMLTAKVEVTVGCNVLIGMGSRIFDSDQHPVDSTHPEVSLPVHIEDDVWIAADATILRGVTVGNSSVVGTRSLVRSSVDPHTVVSGVPAKLYGKVGDRSALRQKREPGA